MPSVWSHLLICPSDIRDSILTVMPCQDWGDAPVAASHLIKNVQ